MASYCSSSFFFLLFKWALLISLLSPSPIYSCDPSDLKALQSFANTLTNASIITSTWSPNTSCCNWNGVSCNISDRVTELHLSNLSLVGPISASLANLTQLRSLDLSLNSLTGGFPTQFTTLAHLQLLNLSYNKLSGPVTSIGYTMPTIKWVDLSSNFFNGSFSDFGTGMPKLLFFNVSNNSITGYIGPDICIGSKSVRVIDLSMNALSGSISGEVFANCSDSLEQLYLWSNSLSGNLPDQLFDLVALEKLSLAFNEFSGGLSEKLSTFSSIKSLVVSANRFSGPIPDVFGNLTKLEQLIAHSNSFSGAIPVSLSLCSMLKDLDLRNNSLSGLFNLDFSGLPLLTSLDLASNYLKGPLPISLSGCRELKTLSLAKNGLSGQIPDEFGNLESLSFLSLSNNSFHNISGALTVLRGCKNLTTLILTKNFHGEEVPKFSNGLPDLEILALGNCALNGEIPFWLRGCEKLQVLDLSWNNFHGSIPPWIGEFENLIYLDISNNSLTGEIPKSLTRLKSVAVSQSSANGRSIVMPLYVKRNQSVLGLPYNQVSSFPPALYLNNNGINGSIWPEFGLLKALHVLDLSNNNISGTIPETFSQMENLEVLDLSFNNLNGSIPQSLSKLTFLSKFSVAHNHLVGEIPTGGQFFSFSNSSFEGNQRLCRAPDPCNKTDVIVGMTPQIPLRISCRIGRSSILGITISIGIGVAVLLAVLLLNLLRKDAIDPSNEEYDEEDGSYRPSDSGSKLVLFFQNSEANKELTISDLLKSTNNFDQANIIGCGGFGLVYKANLPDGTKAAIKRLSSDCGQMEREFRAEVEALSRAQHKNLVSLIGYCRYGNDRLLIYSYMENGSLDYWLHEKSDGGSLLQWNTRLRIAQGSARGLAYLHKVCEPNIIHRDVKSSNILLDEKFEAHLADFGLSRLIRPYDTHVTTDLVGTLGYIPPEYSQSLTATPRGDVFSFGVVLLELLTGRRPVDVCKGKGCRDLVSWVVQKKAEGKEEEVFDEVIRKKGNVRGIMVVLETACRCIGSDPRHRPTIDQVVMWLDGVGVGI